MAAWAACALVLVHALAPCGAYRLLPPRPTTVDLDAAKAAGDLRLFSSTQPRARTVQEWELRMFFKQRSDRDMQRQLGFRTQADADKTVRAIASVSVGGLIASNFLLESDFSALGIVVALVPFAALAAGVALPEAVRGLLVRAWRLDPRYRRRQAYHEAGHFLLCYLLGLAVDTYDVATGGEAASSAVRVGAPGAGAGTAEGARSHAVLDQLAVVSMGGVAAEVIAVGDAEGGIADVAQLRALMDVASPPIIDKSEQDDRIRWGTLMALTLLQNHRPSLDALVDAFDASASVGACVAAIEEAAAAADPAAAAARHPAGTMP